MDVDSKLGEASTGQALSSEFDVKVYEAIRAALAEARASVVVAVNSADVYLSMREGEKYGSGT